MAKILPKLAGQNNRPRIQDTVLITGMLPLPVLGPSSIAKNRTKIRLDSLKKRE